LVRCRFDARLREKIAPHYSDDATYGAILYSASALRSLGASLDSSARLLKIARLSASYASVLRRLRVSSNPREIKTTVTHPDCARLYLIRHPVGEDHSR